MIAMADFDVAVLESLLLDDVDKAWTDDHSDDMEIDDPTYELALTVDHPPSHEPNPQSDNHPVQDLPSDPIADAVPPETLLNLVLSPTKLGARLAIAHQRLLPAPNSVRSDHNSDYDYEFDMSAFKKEKPSSEIGQSLTNSFHYGLSSMLDPAVYSHGAESPRMMEADPDGHMLSARQFPQNFHAQSRFPESISSLQIHHHHYYPEVRHRRVSVGEEISTPKPVSALHADSGAARRFRPSPDDGSSPRDMMAAHSTHLSPILPSPWEPQMHPAQPHAYVLWSYIQLSLNTSVAIYALYLGFCAILAVRADINDELRKLGAAAESLQAAYERLYISNQCEDPVPMQQAQCDEWARRMHQYSGGGFRVQTLAHMIGIVVSRLVEPLTFKVLIVIGSILMLAFAFNFSLGYIRAKTYYGASELK